MRCGCILYYQPQAYPNISICGTADWGCIRLVDQEIQLKQNSSYKCDYCLNGCFSVNYEPTFSTAKLFDKVLRKRGLDPKNVAVLHTYYTRSTFRSRKIEPLYGFTEFLCNLYIIFFMEINFSHKFLFTHSQLTWVACLDFSWAFQ